MIVHIVGQHLLVDGDVNASSSHMDSEDGLNASTAGWRQCKLKVSDKKEARP